MEILSFGVAGSKRGIFVVIMLLVASQKTIDYAYPSTSFHRVEKIAQELSHDLDGLCMEDHVKAMCLQRALYLEKRFFSLHQSVRRLVSISSDPVVYFPEEIDYLLGVVLVLEKKNGLIRCIRNSCEINMEKNRYYHLKRARTILQRMLLCNEEVIR